MKIIHSCTSLSFSGLERYVLELASWQKNNGLDIELFCREGSTLSNNAEELGIKIWTIPKNTQVGPSLWIHLRKSWNEKLQQKPVLHLHHAGELKIHWPWLLRRRFQKKILQYHLWMTHSKRDLFHRFLYSGLDEIWCSSESARSQLQKLLPVDAAKVQVVKYGRDVNRLQALDRQALNSRYRAEWKIPKDAVVGVTVARFEKIKGVHEALEGFIRAAQDLTQAHFVLVGGPSPENQEAISYSQQVEKTIKQCPVSIRSRIHFLGFKPQVEEILAACDYYILPSYEECMSLALLDALAIGLPAIGTDSGGTPSVVQADQTGILVPIKSADAIARAIGRMVSDNALRSRWSFAAKKVGRDHEKEEVFRQIRSAYLS